MGGLLVDEDHSELGTEADSVVVLMYLSMRCSKVVVLGGHALVVVPVSGRQLYGSC